jgi:hypothetical protein
MAVRARQQLVPLTDIGYERSSNVCDVAQCAVLVPQLQTIEQVRKTAAEDIPVI